MRRGGDIVDSEGQGVSTSAIIVDDEAHLVDYLANKLRSLWPELDIVGTASTGRSALALAAETQPDIAFLDIHMPGLSGLQVAEALPAATKIVFVTAFDDYAVEAFQRAAVDYLLKPLTDARLEQTIARVREASVPKRSELLGLLKDISRRQPNFLQWLRAGLADTTQLVPVQDVIYFKADHKYTSIITRQTEYVVRLGITQLEAQLDPDKFWRIHRGVIVRVDQISSAKRDLRGRYIITLRDHTEVLRSSQNYGHLFKQM